jgi:hypothetical protein
MRHADVQTWTDRSIWHSLIHMETVALLRGAVAAEVRAELARQQLPARILSERSDIALTTLRRRLSGKSAFNLDELSRIAAALEVTVPQLVGGERSL